MHSMQRTMAWLLFLIWMVPGLAFAERKGRLIGKILDEEGKPLPGVVVTVTAPEIPDLRETKTTDKKGLFVVNFSRINVTYHYRFDKTGYQTLEAQQEWSLEGTERFEWRMRAATALVVEGAVPASTSAPAILAFNAGVAAIKAKDYATAEAKFREAVGHDPTLRQAWGALSVAHFELGHYQEAAEAAEKAVALGATDESVLVARWQAYRNLNDEAKAAEALKQLESIGRLVEEAKRIHNEAVALAKAGDHAGAFAKFQEAFNLDSNLHESLLGLATSGLKIGRNAEAAAAAEIILKADPKNEKAIRVRYNACLALGDKARLIESLVGLAVVEPLIARDGLLRLAFEAYDANDMESAKERFGKALAVDPDYPQAHYYLGVIFGSQGATEEARNHLQRFLQLAPNDPEASDAREMLKYLSKP
jgi:tetratricopeptide (TPR) repeat protein